MFSLGDGQHIEEEPSIYIDIFGLMLTCCKSHRHPKTSIPRAIWDSKAHQTPKSKQQRTYLPRLESCVFHPRCHVIEPAQRKGSFRSCPAGTPWICILTWLLNSVAQLDIRSQNNISASPQSTATCSESPRLAPIFSAAARDMAEFKWLFKRS